MNRRLNDRWSAFLVCAFVAAIIWLVFGQTRHYAFVNLDDLQYVAENPNVAQGLTLDGIIWAFTHVHSANWHPLTWISHMLDCQLYGLRPGGHHLTNIILHTATAISLFLVLWRMTGGLWRSAFVAALFAIHPLRVESVAWVAERKDVLSGLFFMLILAAYIHYVRRPRSWARYGLVLVLFALGLMCKPMLVTLPLILLLLDYWPLHRLASQGFRRLVLEKLPLLALVAASCLATLVAQTVAFQPWTKISLALRTANAPLSSVIYIFKTFWPSKLAVFYPFASRDIVASRVILSLLLLICISVAVFVFRRRHPYLVTGWLWYLIMLAPVIGILQVGSQARADRYTYLPQIGLIILLTWLVADLAAGWRYRRQILITGSAIVLVALIFAARTQASYWRNSQSLWTHALACTYDNALAEEDLGQAVYENGMVDEAIAHFQRALQIDPNQASVLSSLGAALLDAGRVDESLAHLQKALELDPRAGNAHYNIANTLLRLGRADDALTHYDKAVAIAPNDIQARNNAAWVLATWPDAPVRDGKKAVALAEGADALTNGSSPTIGATLAAAYAEAGRFPEAVKTAQRALQLATAQGDAARASSIRPQLKRYESGLPFRDERSLSFGR